MQVPETKILSNSRGSIRDYLEIIKPRETSLLAFIGVITALVASSGSISIERFLVTLATIFIASAGANGLTNYLDRDFDIRMERTCKRALPSRKIYPPERALFFTAGLSILGLILAWYIHPFAFLADLVGTFSAVIYRKKVTCVFPQGLIASCAPVVMGWLAVKTTINWEILLLCILIAVWLPSHIWSIMVVHREEYRQAGITYFPISYNIKSISRLLFVFCLMLYAASIGLYIVGHFGWLFLTVANLAGITITYAGFRLMHTNASQDAWKLYKLSAFPYLGVLFLVMALDMRFR